MMAFFERSVAQLGSVERCLAHLALGTSARRHGGVGGRLSAFWMLSSSVLKAPACVMPEPPAASLPLCVQVLVCSSRSWPCSVELLAVIGGQRLGEFFLESGRPLQISACSLTTAEVV